MAKEVLGRLSDWAGQRLSRRGFLVRAGKIGLALGVATTGIQLEARKAFAANCCTDPDCTGAGFPCLAAQVCPDHCTAINNPKCCDTTTGQCHYCNRCNCGGNVCVCETNVGTICVGGLC